MDDYGTVQQVAYALQLAIAGVLITSFLAKIRSFASFEDAVREYDLVDPRRTRGVAVAVVAAEGVLGAVLLTGAGGRVGAVVADLLFGVFAGAATINLRRGRLVPCGCFGDTSEPISKRTLVRLGLLIAATSLLLVLTRLGAEVTSVSKLFGQGSDAWLFALRSVTLSSFLVIAAMWGLAAPELVGRRGLLRHLLPKGEEVK